MRIRSEGEGRRGRGDKKEEVEMQEEEVKRMKKRWVGKNEKKGRIKKEKQEEEVGIMRIEELAGIQRHRDKKEYHLLK